MKAKQRFYWLGVIESNKHHRLGVYGYPKNKDWPQWARVAFQAGFYGWSAKYC